jgi:hypothetical protein
MIEGVVPQIGLALMIVACWTCAIKHATVRWWVSRMGRFIMGLVVVLTAWWSLVGVGTLYAKLTGDIPPEVQGVQTVAFLLQPIVMCYCAYLMFMLNRRKELPEQRKMSGAKPTDTAGS